MRLAAGLSPTSMLDAAAQFRGISALRCFNERIRDYPPDAVRAVATNTLRVAKNAPHFLVQAEAALGFPDRGHRRPRGGPPDLRRRRPHFPTPQAAAGGGHRRRLHRVRDRQELQPIALESLYMGCVSYSLRHFPNGRIDKRGLRRPSWRPRRRSRPSPRLPEIGWEEAVGSSGSAKALVDILELNGSPTAGSPAAAWSACAT